MKWVNLHLFFSSTQSTFANCLLILGEEFKEKIIPHAVDFFTGKALDYEDYDDEDDFEVKKKKKKKMSSGTYSFINLIFY